LNEHHQWSEGGDEALFNNETVMPTSYLFLDTQVFDASAYDFQNKHFRQIRALAEANLVCLLMPEITRREIERHIAAKAKEAYAALDKLRRHGFHKNLRVPQADDVEVGDFYVTDITDGVATVETDVTISYSLWADPPSIL
jgi:hypothetical protein